MSGYLTGARAVHDRLLRRASARGGPARAAPRRQRRPGDGDRGQARQATVRPDFADTLGPVINLDCDPDIEVPAMRVPTCQLQHGFGADARGIVPYPEHRIELQAEAEAFYGRRGVNILATCTPYQVGNIPVRGEHCAWMESSAVVYANSVLGARTNCEGTASAGAASLTGKIPCWGNHRDENRYGTHLVDVRTPVDSFLDWGMLGYFAGGVAGEEHPVITRELGRRVRPDLVDLKHFGAAAATSGGVELYHLPGVTPEARPWRPRSGVRGRPSRPSTGRPSGGPCTRHSTPRAPERTWTSSSSAARMPRWTKFGGPPPRWTDGACAPAPSCG